MQGVVGPGFWHIDESWVLVPQHGVVPQTGHPNCHEEHSDTETIEQELAIAVRAEAFLLLMYHHGNHANEGKEEKFSDLSLSDQVP